MAPNLFSIPIFFIVFRETLEASIIVSVLLGLVEQIVLGNHRHSPHHNAHRISRSPRGDGTIPRLSSNTIEHPRSPLEHTGGSSQTTELKVETIGSGESTSSTDEGRNKILIKKLRRQIFLGALSGLLIALAIGAAFIAVWFTQAADLWSKSEDLWEGVFSLFASLIIFVMAITMLKMDRAKAKWKVKLQLAFDGKGKWVLFVLPFITVLREGMEAVVFVGGVSLGQSATSIPIAALVGILCGLIVGYLIYAFSSRTSLTIFLIIMTNLLVLIGAGLFSKAVSFFESNAYNRLLGADVDDSGGDGPGSYQVSGNVWHLDCCNPENNLDGQGWSIFGAIFGWTNSATLGTVLSYVFYWIALVVMLVYLKFHEGRTTFFGRESAKGRERRTRRENKAIGA